MQHYTTVALIAQSVIIEYSDNFSATIGSGIMIEIVIVDKPAKNHIKFRQLSKYWDSRSIVV